MRFYFFISTCRLRVSVLVEPLSNLFNATTSYHMVCYGQKQAEMPYQLFPATSSREFDSREASRTHLHHATKRF